MCRGQATVNQPPTATAQIMVEADRDIVAMALTPDGKYAVTGSRDGIATLWELATGQEIRHFNARASTNKQNDSVISLSVSPDGRYVYVGGGTPRIFDLRTGASLGNYGTWPELHGEFSPDGKLIALCDGNTAELWDVAMNKRLGDPLKAHEIVDFNKGAVFSSDGQFLLMAHPGYARLWRVSDRTEVRKYECVDENGANAVAISGDGKRVFAGCGRIVFVYETATGKLLHKIAVADATPLRFSQYPAWVRQLASTPDGKHLLIHADNGIGLWDVEKEAKIRDFEGQEAVLSADGLTILVRVRDIPSPLLIEEQGTLTGRVEASLHNGTARGWGVFLSEDGSNVLERSEGWTGGLVWHMDGQEPTEIYPEIAPVLSRTGRYVVATGVSDNRVVVRDASSGAVIRTIEGTSRATQIAFDPAETYLLCGREDGSAEVWKTAGSDPPAVLKGKFGEINGVQVSANGKTALITGKKGGAQFFRTTDWRELTDMPATDVTDPSFLLAPDGDYYLATLPHDGALDARDGLLLPIWPATDKHVVLSGLGAVIAFSPDGAYLAAATSSPTGTFSDGGEVFDNGIGVYDMKTGELLWSLSTPVVISLAFSADGQSVLIGHANGAVVLRQARDGKQIKRFRGHTNWVYGVGMAGNHVFSSSWDGTTRIWDATTGKEQLELINALNNRGWAVVAPDGRFDTSELDGGAPLHWVVSDDPMHSVPLEIFMRDYYTPGLLARVMKGENLPELRSIADIKNRVQPDVKVVGVTVSKTNPGRVDVVVHAESHLDKDRNQQSGLQDLRLLRDGQLVANGYREGQLKEGDFTFHDVMLKSGSKKVTFTAYAFNSERIKSTTASLDYTPQAPVPAASAKPRAYLLQIGVNHFGASNCELRYSVNDAEKMSADLSGRLKAAGFDVQAVKLESPEGGNVLAAGKQAIHDRLSAIAAQATPDDVFFMTFSGHGYSAPRGAFYILPSDIQGSCRKVDDTLLKSAISADELGDWLRPIDAGEMTLILDACFSAEGVEAGDFKPGPLGSQGLGQVAYDKRMRVLAASQSDEVAHEYGYLQQGLLTYVLTHDGLDQGKADWKPIDNKIMVGEWLGYAANAVPKFNPASAGQNDSKAAQDRFNNSTPNSVLQIPALFDFSKTDSLQLQ